jgi:hypothetical protein
VIVRGVCVEPWDKDGQKYVIFPAWPRSLYYLYRPLAHLDAHLTGMRFHLGPHAETE